MDEKQPIVLESKNIIYDEPEVEGGAGAEGGEGKKEKKRIKQCDSLVFMIIR